MKKSPWKLDPLFTPRSIAVIGASPNGGAGSIVLRNMQRLGYTVTLYPINPKYKEIFGYPCYASLRDLPAPADCAAVLLGSRSLLPMLEEAHAAGVKGVWGFASGFAETGGEGRAMQRRIHDFCHESGLLFCGPNCVGYANITDKTCMYSAPLPQAFRPGDIGVIAQSGAVLLALGNANRMAGFSRLISSGNEAALGLADYMDYLVDDDATHVIALFIETIRDPEAFAAACSRAAEKGKPVIALKVGRSELACRVAATHTGAIAGSDRILDAFFRRANVMRVNTLDDLLETAVLFSGLRGLSAGSPALMLFLPPQELETPAPVPKAGFFALRVILGGLFGVLTLAALSLCNPYELLRDQHVWGARMTILSSARPREGLVQALLTLAQLFALLIGAVSTLCAAAQALGRAFARIQPLSLWLCALGALGLLLAAAFFGMDVLLCASPLLLLPEGILLVWSFVKR